MNKFNFLWKRFRWHIYFGLMLLFTLMILAGGGYLVKRFILNPYQNYIKENQQIVLLKSNMGVTESLFNQIQELRRFIKTSEIENHFSDGDIVEELGQICEHSKIDLISINKLGVSNLDKISISEFNLEFNADLAQWELFTQLIEKSSIPFKIEFYEVSRLGRFDSNLKVSLKLLGASM